MRFKYQRAILSILVAFGLLLGGTHPTGAQPAAQAAALASDTIFDQPVDPTGKLFLSSWLDPDGSNNDNYVWESFTLPANQTITEIDWTGGYDPTRFGPVARSRIFRSAFMNRYRAAQNRRSPNRPWFSI